MKPETKFRNDKVLPFLQKCRWIWHESIQQIAINGSPDILLGIRGKFVALELKAEDGSLSKLQAFKLQDAIDKGNLAFVARPSNWKIIKRFLWKLNKGEDLHEQESSYSKAEIQTARRL